MNEREVNGVMCYGELLDDSNFELVFDDDWDDGVWTDGNPITDDPFQSWEELVSFFTAHFPDNTLIEVSAC